MHRVHGIKDIEGLRLGCISRFQGPQSGFRVQTPQGKFSDN